MQVRLNSLLLFLFLFLFARVFERHLDFKKKKKMFPEIFIDIRPGNFERNMATCLGLP